MTQTDPCPAEAFVAESGLTMTAKLEDPGSWDKESRWTVTLTAPNGATFPTPYKMGCAHRHYVAAPAGTIGIVRKPHEAPGQPVRLRAARRACLGLHVPRSVAWRRPSG